MVEQLDEVTIRVATEGDAAGIARVHVRSWQEAYAGIVPDAYLASLDADERTAQWAHVPARGPVGRDPHLGRPRRRTAWSASSPWGPAATRTHARGDREIFSIYLDPGTWGHGVARDLMRTVIAEVGEKTTVTLWVLADNERARHFYRRHGFQADGVDRYDDIGGASLLEVRYRRG